MSLPHLDDDALSAALDGVGTDTEHGHLAGCDLCGQRLEALRAVARAVAAPVVPAPPAVVDAAIRRALDAAAAVTMAGDAAGGAGAAPAEWVASAGGTAADRPTPRPADRESSASGLPAPGEDGWWVSSTRRPSGRAAGRAPGGRGAHRRPSPTRTRILAVAAVLVAVLGLAGLVTALGRSGSSAQKTTASAQEPGPVAASETTVAGAASTAAAGAVSTTLAPGGGGQSPNVDVTGRPTAAGPVVAGPVVEGPDLGQQSDPTALARQLTAVVATLLQPPGAGSNPAAGGAAPAAQPCDGPGLVFARLAGQAAVLRYVATLRYQGADAVVLIYARSGGWTAVVVRSTDCGGLLLLPSV